jgi:hypothetical protein
MRTKIASFVSLDRGCTFQFYTGFQTRFLVEREIYPDRISVELELPYEPINRNLRLL